MKKAQTRLSLRILLIRTLFFKVLHFMAALNFLYCSLQVTCALMLQFMSWLEWFHGLVDL